MGFMNVSEKSGQNPKALVAIAAKNARIAWALLSKDQTLRAV